MERGWGCEKKRLGGVGRGWGGVRRRNNAMEAPISRVKKISRRRRRKHAYEEEEESMHSSRFIKKISNPYTCKSPAPMAISSLQIACTNGDFLLLHCHGRNGRN